MDDGAYGLCLSRTNFFIVFDLWIEREHYECGSSTLIPMTANACVFGEGKKMGSMKNI